MTRGKFYDDRDEMALRAQLLWKIGDSTTAEFSYDDFSNDFAGLIGESTVDRLAPRPYEVALDTKQLIESENDGFGLQVNHTFANDFVLTSITGVRSELYSVRDNDEDYTPQPVAFTDLTDSDGDYVSQEFRIASPEGERFDYVVGLYYLDQEVTVAARHACSLARWCRQRRRFTSPRRTTLTSRRRSSRCSRTVTSGSPSSGH